MWQSRTVFRGKFTEINTLRKRKFSYKQSIFTPQEVKQRNNQAQHQQQERYKKIRAQITKTRQTIEKNQGNQFF